MPDVRVHLSFVEAMAEFRSEGRGDADDGSSVGRAIREHGAVWRDPRVFAGFVESVRDEAREDRPHADGTVPCTTLWYVDGDTYLGRLAIRHVLTRPLLEWGGHIGYDVRPTARRRGHATAMLRDALPHARAVGIESALVTCDTDNVASRKVIESSGGVFEDVRVGKRRYWVPTRPES